MTVMPVERSAGVPPRRALIDSRHGPGSVPGASGQDAERAGAADDRAIVRAVIAGDSEAYRVLVEREAIPVVRACHEVLGDVAEAQGVAQETFMTAYRSLSSWRGDGPFGRWLASLALKLADRRRGRRTEVRWLGPAAAAGSGAEVGETLRLNHDFVDRIMGALVEEPRPGALSFLAPLRRGVAGLRESVRQGWATVRGAGRPAVGRVAALAYVVIVVIAGVTFTGAAAVGAVNALGVFRVETETPTRASPRPSQVPSPSASVRPS